METEEVQRQRNEILALESIYENDIKILQDCDSTKNINFKCIIRITVVPATVPFKVESGEKIIELSNLPPIFLIAELPPKYPVVRPICSIQSLWLEANNLEYLELQLDKLWEETQEEILFTHVDYLQNMLLEELGSTVLLRLGQMKYDPSWNKEGLSFIEEGFPSHIIQHKGLIPLTGILLDWDSYKLKKEFDAQPHACGICFDVKKGRSSISLSQCGHIYCRDCLKGFFVMLIREGMMFSVVCPHAECQAARKGKKVNDEAIRPAPQDILALVGEDGFARYQRLYRKQSMELDPLITWCPHCERGVPRNNIEDKLCQCSHCSFAFCRICRKTWHGNQSYCQVSNIARVTELYFKAREEGNTLECERLEHRYGKKNLIPLIAELEAQKQFEAWSSSNAQSCPNCRSVIEKTYGCNHMTCPVCDQHFCYICGEFVNKFNPYSHFNDLGSRCHMMLFEGVQDEDEEFFINPFDII